MPTLPARFHVISFGGNRRCERGKNGSPASMTALMGTVARNPEAAPAIARSRARFMQRGDANGVPRALTRGRAAAARGTGVRVPGGQAEWHARKRTWRRRYDRGADTARRGLRG